ncbi:MAG: hypothetical protein WBA74_08470, partial [Cyclobacteriaceae bacterium]
FTEVRLKVAGSRDMIFYIMSLENNKLKVVDYPSILTINRDYLNLTEIDASEQQAKLKDELIEFRKTLEGLVTNYPPTIDKVIFISPNQE